MVNVSDSFFNRMFQRPRRDSGFDKSLPTATHISLIDVSLGNFPAHLWNLPVACDVCVPSVDIPGSGEQCWITGKRRAILVLAQHVRPYFISQHVQ